jgi:hypothetical protein
MWGYRASVVYFLLLPTYWANPPWKNLSIIIPSSVGQEGPYSPWGSRNGWRKGIAVTHDWHGPTCSWRSPEHSSLVHNLPLRCCFFVMLDLRPSKLTTWWIWKNLYDGSFGAPWWQNFGILALPETSSFPGVAVNEVCNSLQMARPWSKPLKGYVTLLLELNMHST